MKFAIAQLRHLYDQLLNGHVKDTKEAANGLLGPAIIELEKYEPPELDRIAELEEALEIEKVTNRCNYLAITKLENNLVEINTMCESRNIKINNLQSIIDLLPHCMGEWIPNESGMKFLNKKCDRLATYQSVYDEYAHCDLHGFKTIVFKEVGWASAVRILEPCPVVEAVVEEVPKKMHLPVIK